jgi:chromosome segregation ATPase
MSSGQEAAERLTSLRVELEEVRRELGTVRSQLASARAEYQLLAKIHADLAARYGGAGAPGG